ncbi:MAG: M15 family metallopeptidase [Candidatus Riflebacteria bacterium]|nr:M15 family metallopeptidase [Candidatus Riflebacteria bacterium]
MASRSLDDLHPKLRNLAKTFKKICLREGVPVLIYMTYRSNEDQDELYAQGRTKPGNIVTNVKGGKSDHNFTLNGKPASLAFDAVPIRKTDNGDALIWNDPNLWAKMGDIAQEIGLKWGGNWKKFVDKPHFYIELKES